jgi:hypothetical protein
LLSKWLLSANSSRLKDVPTEPITVMLSKGNILLFPTTLIESNAMKRLVTLIFSAALLCPMWAGAQTKTTPSVVGPLNYSGQIGLIFGGEWNSLFLGGLSPECTKINAFSIHLLAPNNESPVKSASGIVTCEAGTYVVNNWAILWGNLIATNGLSPASAGTPITGYKGMFRVGNGNITCDFSADLINATCELVVFGQGIYPATVTRTGNFVNVN